MQEGSSSSMIAPLSDGNTQDMDSLTEAAAVKDDPHAGATTDKGGPSPSPRPQGPAGVGDGDVPSMPRAGATTGKGGSSRSPRPQGTAEKGDGDESSIPPRMMPPLSRRTSAGKKDGKGNGDEPSVSSLSEQSRQSPRSLWSRLQMSETKKMMAGMAAMQAGMIYHGNVHLLVHCRLSHGARSGLLSY